MQGNENDSKEIKTKGPPCEAATLPAWLSCSKAPGASVGPLWGKGKDSVQPLCMLLWFYL